MKISKNLSIEELSIHTDRNNFLIQVTATKDQSVKVRSSYEEFIAEYNKTGLIWIESRLISTRPFAFVCEKNALIAYNERPERTVWLPHNEYIRNDLDCLNYLMLISSCVFPLFPLQDWSIPITKLTMNNKIENVSIKNTELDTDVVYCWNWSNRTQPCSIRNYTQTVTETIDYSLITGRKLTSERQINVPLVGDVKMAGVLFSRNTNETIYTNTKKISGL